MKSKGKAKTAKNYCYNLLCKLEKDSYEPSSKRQKFYQAKGAYKFLEAFIQTRKTKTIENGLRERLEQLKKEIAEKSEEFNKATEYDKAKIDDKFDLLQGERHAIQWLLADDESEINL